MYYFIMGYLSAVLTLFLVGTVIGIVYLIKLKKEVSTIQQDFRDNMRDNTESQDEIYRTVNQLNGQTITNIDELRDELTSLIDSRIDKLRQSIKE